MTFKSGKPFDSESFGRVDWQYLSPFKHKGPMKNRIVVETAEQEQWPLLTEMALALMQASS